MYLLFFVWGAALLAGFFITAHATDIRYYAPSFLVLLGILPLVYDQFDSRRAYPVLVAATVIIFLFSVPKIIDGVQTLRSLKNVDLYATQVAASLIDCIPRKDQGEVWITGEDFIASTAWPEYASSFVQKYGKTLCKP